MAVVSPTSDTVLANADAAWPAAAETTALVTVLAAAAAPGYSDQGQVVVE